MTEDLPLETTIIKRSEIPPEYFDVACDIFEFRNCQYCSRKSRCPIYDMMQLQMGKYKLLRPLMKVKSLDCEELLTYYHRDKLAELRQEGKGE